MGLFDFLFGRKRDDDLTEAPASVPTGPLPWRERLELARGEEDFDWDWGNAGAHRLVHGVLEEAAPRFGNDGGPARIKEVPDDENIDLRGTHDGAPIRFAVWMSFGNFWTIEMRVPELGVAMDLERDHEKIPKRRDEADPFDDDEGVRVFVARGIFFEGDEDDVEAALATWSRIDASARERILQDMEALDVTTLMCHGTSLNLNQRPGLTDLDDPIAYMERCAAFLAGVRDALAGLGAAPDAPVETTVITGRVTCSYCSSRFIQTPVAQNCPNCGAAPGT